RLDGGKARRRAVAAHDAAAAPLVLHSGKHAPVVHGARACGGACGPSLEDRSGLADTHNGLRAMTPRGAAPIRLRRNRVAHASEWLSQIAASGLRYVEWPVTVEYTAYSMAKGQTIADAVLILVDLFARRLYR